jgi:hypothetical protein
MTLYNSSWKSYQLAAGHLLSGQSVRYGKSRQYRPSITYNTTSAGSLSSSQSGWLPCWASSLAFGLFSWLKDFLQGCWRGGCSLITSLLQSLLAPEFPSGGQRVPCMSQVNIHYPPSIQLPLPLKAETLSSN